jgi:hypothetical protein
MQLPGRRVVWLRSLVLPVVAGGLMVATVSSRATILPGGGPQPDGDGPFVDCYVYAEAVGTLAATNSKYLVCTDGDPTCDQDRSCNGTCRFRARVCTRLRGVAGCESPPSLDSLRLNQRCPLQRPDNLTGSVCGAFVDFDVALRGRAKRRHARCVSRAAAPRSVSKRTDSDVFVFTCVAPRGGCPSSPSGAFLESRSVISSARRSCRRARSCRRVVRSAVVFAPSATRPRVAHRVVVQDARPGAAADPGRGDRP